MPLLISNRKPPLCLLVLVGKGLEILDRVGLRDGKGKFHVGFGVFVAGEDPSVVRQGGQRLVESLVHLSTGAFEEFTAAAVEEGISGEDSLITAVLHEPADAVLSVAGRVQRLDGDAAEVEGLAVGGGAGYFLAVLAADDVEGLVKLHEHLGVATGVVPMVVGVDDGGKVDAAILDGLLENRDDLGRMGGINDYGIFGLVVDNQVGVVVATAHPHGN